MKNFLRLEEGIDVMPTLVQIATQSDLWDQHTLRTRHPGTAHSDISDIWMRFNEVRQDNEHLVVDDTEAINYPAWYRLPLARSLVHSLVARVQGERIGRVLITKLPPGKKIAAHVDMGAPATYYKRFHIVLQSSPGCIFRAGDEQVHMKTGECWWFDNKQEHEVINNGADDRVHVVVDIRVS